MTISIIGFPRIGTKRELKFATEKYFRGEINEAELRAVASQIRIENWKLQQAVGIEFPVSNDSSLYDQTLDTAFFLNVIPKRYQALGLNKLDTYFALARGYQGKQGDVKALPMKKWFNTNYHYLVPEFSRDTRIKADCTKLLNQYNEAKELGIDTRPAIIGPFTFLKQADYLDGVALVDFVDDLLNAYSDLLTELNKQAVKWLQIDEPALVFDLSSADIALFSKIYRKLLAKKGKLKVLLQTYFGDVRDTYQELISLDFDGIGLDFVEGKESLNLVKTYDFPTDKTLFAGIINGKNIWRNDYAKSLALLKELPANTVISTSCSLQHVPVTVKSEEQLSADILKHFAFAVEKLSELQELDAIHQNQSQHYLATNQALFDGSRVQRNTNLAQQIADLHEADFMRSPKLTKRRSIQQAALQLPLLPTTTIGSFPQTTEIRKARLKHKRRELSDADYQTFLETETSKGIKQQEKIGLDVLVHGEFERNDMVEYFGEQLEGYVFTQFAWVQSYGTRCVKPPVVWGDITRPKPMTVAWAAFAQSQTDKIVKGMLTGPVTILNWSFPREDISHEESTLQLALAIQAEVLDLEAAGIKIIQIDEAALREKLPLRKSDWFSDYLDWAIPAFRLVHSRVQPQTQIHTHMCYSEFTDIIQAIDNMDADVISFEASRSDLTILDSLAENHFQTLVGPGVYDIHSPRIPSTAELKSQVKKILAKVPAKQVWINPDCGLKTRGNAETWPSLLNMVQAAKTIRTELEE